MEKVTGWAVGQQNPKDSPGDLKPLILHTEDGDNWQAQPLGEEYDSFLPNDVIMADEDHAFVVGGFGETQSEGITLFTSNRGKTWDSTDGGMPELPSLSCVGLRGSELWASGERFTIVRSKSLSKIQWESMTAGKSLPALLAQGFSFASRNVVYVACNWPDVPGGVWKSTDGGREWAQLPTPKPPQGDAGFIGVFPLSEEVVFAYGGHGLLVKTTDGGETWEFLMDEEAGPGDNNGLWARNERDIWVARDNNVLYHTWVGENRWEGYNPVQDGGWVVDVKVVGRSVWVAASANSVNSGGFALSRDYGATWETPTTDLPPDVHVQFNSLSLQRVM